MQRLEHDMDDLFRKAAEEYPLKTSENEWDAVASQLAGASSMPENKKEKGRKGRKYFFPGVALLLFLVLGGISYKYFNNAYSTYGNASQNLTSGDLPEQKASENTASKKSNAIDYKAQYPNTGGGKITQKENRVLSSFENKIETESLVKINEAEESYQSEKDLFTPLHSFILTKNEEVKKPGSLLDRNAPSANSSEKTLRSDGSKRGIYWGLAGGPQLNEVKSQGLNKTGFDLGIVAGYRFNRRLSVETGLFYSTKYYFSDGKYFNMIKTDPTMPANMKLLSLRGRSNVFEAPLKLRYDLFRNYKNNIYATAGIASYLLTKENNNYHAMVNGTPEDMQRSYNDVVHYAAASINLSAGYEYRVLKRSSIRVEPYVQIPLKGIGVGAMPLTSAGLHIGFTRSRK